MLSAYRAGIRPDPILTTSQWAGKFRQLAGSSSPFPGRWQNPRMPFLVGPMDAMSPTDPCEFVACMFASQLGKTEIILNAAGRAMHMSPGPMLMVQPDMEMAKRFSRQRIEQGLIEPTPVLRALVAPAKSRDGANTILMKEFRGGTMIFAGSNSSSSLSSMPARYAYLDEVDKFSEEASGEGDTIDQCIQRTAAFVNRKILLTSTPTFKGNSNIETWYELGDQNRYWVPCPQCGEFQVLIWDQVKWDPNKPKTAHYVCVHNGCVLENRHKSVMLPRGEWRPDRPDADGQIRSFHLSALYTPHGWPNDWAELARLWLAARKNNVKRKAFVNLKLAETWDPFAIGGVAHDYLHSRTTTADEEFGYCIDARGHETLAPLPDDVVLLTCAVDVQDDRLQVELRGWGVGQQAWSIDHRRMPGDLSAPQVWDVLDRYLSREYRTVSGWTMPIERTCIDSGGHFTQSVYDFVRHKRTRHIMAIKGRAGQIPVWNPKPSQSTMGRCPLYIVGVDPAKEEVYARLRVDKPGPGFVHFPRGRAAEYFKSLTVERQVKIYVAGQPRIRWVCPPHTPNEGLDLAVYNYAALKSWLMASNSLEARAARRASSKPEVDAATKAAQSAPVRPVPGTAPREPDWLEGVGEDWLG